MCLQYAIGEKVTINLERKLKKNEFIREMIVFGELEEHTRC